MVKKQKKKVHVKDNFWKEATETIEDIVFMSIEAGQELHYAQAYYEQTKKLEDPRYEFNFREFMSEYGNRLLDDYNYYIKEHGFDKRDSKEQALFDIYYDMLETSINPRKVFYIKKSGDL